MRASPRMRAARSCSRKAGSTPRAGSASGTEDERFAWSTRVEPWEAPDAAPASGGLQQLTPTQLYRISVEVRYPGAGGRERVLELATLKLARREGTP